MATNQELKALREKLQRRCACGGVMTPCFLSGAEGGPVIEVFLECRECGETAAVSPQDEQEAVRLANQRRGNHGD